MCTEASDAERASLTAGQLSLWLLRNLAVLMGAFLPTLLMVTALRGCLGVPRDERCGAAIAFAVPLVWLWFALPVLLFGGVPVCLVLAVAWRRPRLARALAVLYALAFVLVSAPRDWVREAPLDVPLVALLVLYYGFMLRLDPRQPLGQAAWVWRVPLGLAAAALVLGMAGLV